jgi:hypothetical protein
MEFIKPKNNTSANSLENRLLRIEKILLQLTEISGIGQNTDSLAVVDIVTQKDLFTSSAIPMVIRNSSTVSDFNVIPIRSGNNAKMGRSSLFLSQGQIIAELAAAISRISQRNL